MDRDLQLAAITKKLQLAVASTTGTLTLTRGADGIPSGARGVALLGLLKGWDTDTPSTTTNVPAIGLRVKRGSTVLHSIAIRDGELRPMMTFEPALKCDFSDSTGVITIESDTAAVATNDVVFEFFYVPY